MEYIILEWPVRWVMMTNDDADLSDLRLLTLRSLTIRALLRFCKMAAEDMSIEEAMSLSDVDEQLLQNLGQANNIPHLSVAQFPSPALPVRGVIHGPKRRCMIPLVTRLSDDPSATPINVWFMIITRFPTTFMSAKTKRALLGNDVNLDEPFHWISIQDQNTKIKCYTSPAGSDFEHGNMLGMDTLCALKAQLNINMMDNFLELKA